MKIKGQHYRTIWVKENEPGVVQTIDQRLLPFNFEILDLRTPEDYEWAIAEMIVRGAPLIGVTAAYGMYAATLSKQSRHDILKVAKSLKKTRPTAVDLFNSIDRMTHAIKTSSDPIKQSQIALSLANQMAEESVEGCKKIGEYGLEVIKKISKKKNGEPVNILTHCNAGWLACIDYGTATAPVYLAHEDNIPVHVWVDETRPRNQGSRLTAFELGEHGVPHTVIADNTGGHLMQHGMVDMVIVGTDRTTRTGDVANKIGTYGLAVLADAHQIPFYVAAPASTFDLSLASGEDIPIEQRSSREVTHGFGVATAPDGVPVYNPAFDVTPARYVRAIVTEYGLIQPVSAQRIQQVLNSKTSTAKAREP